VTFRTRAAELVVGEASAGLEGGDAIPLLGEPQGRDRTAETGTEDDDVVVMVGGNRHRWRRSGLSAWLRCQP
jgi:hypothetical protein